MTGFRLLVTKALRQLGLFDETVLVHPHVRKDGTMVEAHTRVQKKRPKIVKPVEAPKPAEPAEYKPKVGDIVTTHVIRRGLHFDLVGKLSEVNSDGTAFLTLTEKPPRSSYRVGMALRVYQKELSLQHRPAPKVDNPLPEVDKPKPKEAKKILSIRKKEKPAAPAPAPEAAPAPRPEQADNGRDYSVPFEQITVPDFGVKAGVGKTERKALNVQARNILANGGTDPDDLDALKKYSGTGGIGDSLNEFYTDPHVAAAMWKNLAALGLRPDAQVLEPCCATGVFLETAPGRARVVGVELDKTSSAIAKVLHGARHEVQNSSLEAFATTDTRQFDAVIGNVPFGLRGSFLKDDKPELKTAEQYFVDTAVDKCVPGGLVALIVPTGIMDSKSGRAFRERIQRKAQFLGAVRMPNTAFEAAHTEVTTDVIYLRRRPDDVMGALMATDREVLKKLGVYDEEFVDGRYFTGRGAPHIFGTQTEGWRAQAGMGDDITVEGSMHGVPEGIAGTELEAGGPAPTVQDVLAAVGDDEKARSRVLGGALRKPYDRAKVGDTKIVDGVTYVLQGNPPRWWRLDEAIAQQAVQEALGIANDIERMFQGRGVNRPALEARIRDWVGINGLPVKHQALQVAAQHNKVLHRLIGAVAPDGTLSEAVRGVTTQDVKAGFEAAADLAMTAHETGSFTPEEVAERWTEADSELALEHLYGSDSYALEPGGTWTTMANYCTGELWPKVDALNAELEKDDLPAADRAKYEAQLKALEEAIAPKVLEDVDIQINSGWVPFTAIEAFFNERRDNSDNTHTQQNPDLRITFKDGEYLVAGGGYGIHDLLYKYLNRSGVRKDDMPTIEAWNKEFKEWLCSSMFRDRVEELYNRKFRGFVAREYSKNPIDVPGLANRDRVRDYKWPGLRWALERGKGIIAEDVGLGKTVLGLMLVRMARVDGRAERPLIVVPKSVLANWKAEAELWFPGSKVMVIGETYTTDKDGNLKGKEDGPEERARKYHDIQQNDYDFILISEPAFNELDLNPIQKKEYHDDDFWVQRSQAMEKAGDKRRKKIEEQFKQAMADREFQKRTNAVYFDDLKVDMLIMDEAHHYKNLYAARARWGESPKYLGGQGLSNRALDTNLKARWVRDHAGGRNVFGLTATPTKNSPLEIYSMLSHICPEEFERMGIKNSEDFLDRFCMFENDNIFTTDGKIEQALVTAGFKNMSELREVMDRYIYRRTAADVGLQLPERNDHEHLVDMTDDQQAVYSELRAMADGDSEEEDVHIFSIIDKMGKAALDLEMYDPKRYAGAHSPKYKACAEQVKKSGQAGGQLIFVENIAAHERMVKELVKAGIPRDQIAVVNAQVAQSSAKRQTLSDKFNAGKIKVLIGNSTMAEGMNLQKNTTDIHHLDLPWEPASVQQRNGRGLRQGNTNEAIRIHTYLARGSFDGFRWATIRGKKDWADILWSGQDRVENLSRESRLTRDDMMIMLSADPDAERAKRASDKEAATEAFNAAQRRSTAEKFVRFQELSRAVKSFKDRAAQTGAKGTKASERLQYQYDRARKELEKSPFFPDKAVLDMQTDAVMHPVSGQVFYPGVAFTVGEDSGIEGGGHWVVTGITRTMRNRETKENKPTVYLKLRRYASISNEHKVVGLHELAHGCTAVPYDQAAERAEIATAAASASVDQTRQVKGAAELVGVPAEIIRDNYAHIQKQIKELAKEYGDKQSYGDKVVMLNAEGRPVPFESYEYRKKLDDHDFLLPIPEHREKLAQAWMEARRGRKFSREYTTGKRGRQGRERIAIEYPDYGYGVKSNPFSAAGEKMFGKEFRKELVAKLNKEQYEAALHVKGFDNALRALLPTVHATGWNTPKWPKRALAILWSRAKDAPEGATLGSMIPRVPTKYGTEPIVPRGFFNTVAYGQTARDYESMPVREALREMANRQGDHDLAAAMTVAEGRAKGEDIRETVKELASIGPSYGVIAKPAAEAIRHVLARAGREGMTVGELGLHRGPDSVKVLDYVARNQVNAEPATEEDDEAA